MTFKKVSTKTAKIQIQILLATGMKLFVAAVLVTAQTWKQRVSSVGQRANTLGPPGRRGRTRAAKQSPSSLKRYSRPRSACGRVEEGLKRHGRWFTPWGFREKAQLAVGGTTLGQ